VIWEGIGLVANRIEHEPNSDPPIVVIRSVNPEYKSYERSAEGASGASLWNVQAIAVPKKTTSKGISCDVSSIDEDGKAFARPLAATGR
jgi:hypothetical protein